jgi:amino acid transporter
LPDSTGEFRMTEKDLSWEERNQLYKLCAIPMCITFCIFLVYFVYLMQNALIQTTWDFLTKILIEAIIIPTLVFALAFELLYHRKIKKSLKFHLKRFGMSASLILVSALSIFALLSFLDSMLSPFLGGRAILIGAALWALIFFIIVTKYQKFFRKF